MKEATEGVRGKVNMGGRIQGQRRSRSGRVRRRKIFIASAGLILVAGLAAFAANGGFAELFNVEKTDIPDIDQH